MSDYDELPFADMVEVVDEDGEITEVPLGDVDLAQLAALALEATEQTKLWEERKVRYNGLLAFRQVDDRAVYGDASVRCWFPTSHDPKLFRAIVEESDIDVDDVYELLFAAAMFSTKLLPPRLQDLVQRSRVPTGKRAAQTRRARKLAPREE